MSPLGYHGNATESHDARETTPMALDMALLVSGPDFTAPSISKGRPKLSLQTSSLPSPYARSSKLVLGSARGFSDAATPTTSNTIANSEQVTSSRPSPSTSERPCSRLLQSRPYRQPIGLRSILKNAPESPKLGTKRSYSLFLAESGSSHTRRRTFFPSIKHVKFEDDQKLMVEIPAKEQLSLGETTSPQDESDVPGAKDSPLQIISDEQEDADVADLTGSEAIRGAPRTRNSTPPPRPKPVRLKRRRKVVKWEWTITSPALRKQDEREQLEALPGVV